MYSIIPTALLLLIFLAGGVASCATVPEGVVHEPVPDEPDPVSIVEEEIPVASAADESARVELVPPAILRVGAATIPAVPVRPPRSPVEETVDRILAGMTIEERVGQLFMPAIMTSSRGRPLLEVTDEVRATLDGVRPGGVILFGTNLRDPEQTRAMIQDLQTESVYPLLVAVDQEGGVVSRLTSSATMPATVVPSARRVGLAGDEELAYRVARTTGKELRSLGITMNFAPVADVLTNPANPVIGSRAFGSDPELVARMVAATVKGLQDAGVSAVVKHFPGHGDTVLDTHLQAVMVPHTIDRLREVEFTPFASGFAAGADGVMTAHISLPNVTGDDTPSTLSAMMLQTVLREEFSFRGLIVTDSLTMGALNAGSIARHTDEATLPLRAFQAGADILLYPRYPVESHRRFVEAVKSGEVSEEAVNAAVRRVLRVKLARGLLQPADPESILPFRKPDRFFPEELALGLPEHRDLMEEVLRRSR